ncbi:MAG: peptidase U32 family protein [Bacteroidales bacterium]
MKITRNDVNIMAPVGSYESLSAAIQGGANSVYFGVEKLNMRARSSANFTLNDLHTIVQICQKENIKTYLTVNTVLFDDELNVVKNIIDEAKKAKITAIIASDQSVIAYAKRQDVEVHISTQLNISNVETLEFYSSYADVMVLARELNLRQVKHISEEIRERNICGPRGHLVQLEMFCHGALCMATSGKCYISLHENNHSANRGGCLQNCRRSYIVKEKESATELEIDHDYILSPKDLCTIDILDKMLDAGVRVFKIEGRARSAEYVKIVCECYNEAFKAIIDKKYDKELIKTLLKRLTKVFNRGFWNGYYLGERLGQWSKSYGSQATHRKEYLAKVSNYFTKLNVAEFLMESGKLSIGDDVVIIGPNTGVIEVKIVDLRNNSGASVMTVKKGEVFSIAVLQKLRRADKLYLWVKS